MSQKSVDLTISISLKLSSHGTNVKFCSLLTIVLFIVCSCAFVTIILSSTVSRSLSPVFSSLDAKLLLFHCPSLGTGQDVESAGEGGR